MKSNESTSTSVTLISEAEATLVRNRLRIVVRRSEREWEFGSQSRAVDLDPKSNLAVRDDVFDTGTGGSAVIDDVVTGDGLPGHDDVAAKAIST